MLDINIHNETSELKSVLVGIADDFGGTPLERECYDPKSIENVRAGTFPKEDHLKMEINGLASILDKYGVKVFRPSNIKGLNQIFTRDIAFVIENQIVISNMIQNRKKEIDSLDVVLNKIDLSKIIRAPDNVRVEGGDVIMCNDYLFIGYSEEEDFTKHIVSRTNKSALSFLQKTFPNKKIKGFELSKSDINAKENALHLDCCFQPVGGNKAILYEKGFKNYSDVNFLINYFGKENIIHINQNEMYDMNANIFSVSEKVVISDKNFVRLNKVLTEKGFFVEEVSYSEIAKMEGLLRCSTMPLIRL